MKVLHLASFHGNIGDNANHSGFRPWLEKLAGRSVEWTDLEIREFYWRERLFDESFLTLVNGFDLLVVGGGNYFELWVERSHTGTSIDIPLEMVSRIRPPMFFNALGCDAGQGTTDTTVSRFNAFLDLLVKNPRALVTLRNDGAQQTLRRFVPAVIADRIATIPDGGFFLTQASARKSSTKRVGINLACDMPEVRFRDFGGGLDAFCDELSAAVGLVARSAPDVDFIFFPHIYGDLKIISAVLQRVDDRLRRTRVSVAPYLTGPEGAAHIFGLYRQCDAIAGMRFHANVCALGMEIPTVGLNNYPQIELLYAELGRPEKCLDVKQPGFAPALATRVLASLSGGPDSEALARVAALRRGFEPVLRDWLQRCLPSGDA